MSRKILWRNKSSWKVCPTPTPRFTILATLMRVGNDLLKNTSSYTFKYARRIYERK